MTEPSDPSLPPSDSPVQRQPEDAGWVPLVQVVELLYHPNFHWCAHQVFADCKYLELRVDTRDNWCLVRDQNGRALNLSELRQALENPTLEKMNENAPLALLPVPPALPDYPEDVPLFEPEEESGQS